MRHFVGLYRYERVWELCQHEILLVMIWRFWASFAPSSWRQAHVLFGKGRLTSCFGSTFTAGNQQTLPIWIFSQMLKPRNRPITNVTAMLVVLITALPILFAQRITAGASESEGRSKYQSFKK